MDGPRDSPTEWSKSDRVWHHLYVESKIWLQINFIHNVNRCRKYDYRYRKYDYGGSKYDYQG